MATIRIRRSDYDIFVLGEILRELYGKPVHYSSEAIPGSEDEWFYFPNHTESEILVALQEPKVKKPQIRQIQNQLALSDLPLIRGIEDLCDILISKRLITSTELPAALQSKIQARKNLRTELKNA